MLCDELSVSTVTVDHAYALLCDEGYAEARERSGYVVIFHQSDGFASASNAAHTAHTADQRTSDYTVFPRSVLSKTMRKILTENEGLWLEKSPNSGSAELREAIRRYLARNRGIEVTAEQIVIGSGAEYRIRPYPLRT